MSTYVEPSTCLSEDASDIAMEHQPTHFTGFYASAMEMVADAATVASYLNAHQAWFPRCASPMKSESLGDNGYGLTIGRFGSFGYEVEPKIGLHLLPPDENGVYRIETIAIPGYESIGYEVDFKASLQLVESEVDAEAQSRLRLETAPTVLTNVTWELNLDVAIQFPRFIQSLPKSLVQSTGDRLLNQIVRQVSRSLTQKVQDDFHQTQGIAVGKKRKLLW
ncbi:DUF1997 domain-containing protein [Leptolyngbya sp. AN02str]|uniref:DUF1997 domain-containing protein n=1 Tax=Leptolyngbya sp. AN02str TaxID=3423363 RepID=UPI003D3157A8